MNPAGDRSRDARRRGIVLAAPWIWLLAFFFAPFAIVLTISFSQGIDAMPPFAPLVDISRDGVDLRATLGSYQLMLSDDLYYVALWNAVRIAAVSTIICLLIGYPLALAIVRAPASSRSFLLMLAILPFWTSFLIRVYAWMALLRPTGIINSALMWLGLIVQPVQMIDNAFAVHLGIIYSYLPFMVLPLYAALEKIDPALGEAAADLGARPMRIFAAVTLPLSLPGAAAGCLLVFIPAVGEFVIPDLLGGPNTPMIGRVLWNEFFANRDWPAASAIATVLLAILVAPIVVFQQLRARIAEKNR
ncbi:MAG: ABC transporter permease subunit [Rhodospirillales bacterium]|nr:ABC transporter permease subunit [Rhodospirillales bacterium]